MTEGPLFMLVRDGGPVRQQDEPAPCEGGEPGFGVLGFPGFGLQGGLRGLGVFCMKLMYILMTSVMNDPPSAPQLPTTAV